MLARSNKLVRYVGSTATARQVSVMGRRRLADSSLSGCHPPRATPSTTINRFLLLPVDRLIVTRMTCPLRSTGITPLRHYYEAVRTDRSCCAWIGSRTAICAYRMQKRILYRLPCEQVDSQWREKRQRTRRLFDLVEAVASREAWSRGG